MRGDECHLLIASSLVGTFDHTNVSGFRGFERASVRCGPSDASLSIVAAADTNGDRYVNANDYDQFADLFDARSLLGDWNGNGIVTFEDFASFVEAFMHG